MRQRSRQIFQRAPLIIRGQTIFLAGLHEIGEIADGVAHHAVKPWGGFRRHLGRIALEEGPEHGFIFRVGHRHQIEQKGK